MRKTLASLVLCGMSLFNPLNATAEKVIETPKLEVIVNYEAETTSSPIDYATSKNRYSIHTESLFRNRDNPQLSLIEEMQIGEIISDIQNNNITSYQEFLEASDNLSENQQLVLAKFL